ncbi:MAG TPA: tetratricopeptide repeat protein, partial [Clostridia bacterium]
EYIKGRCYFEMRDLKNSKKHFTNAIKIYNQVIHEIQELRKTNILAASQNELSRIYYYENNLQKALEHADKGIQSYVNDGERPNTRFYLYVNKAMYLEKLDKNEDALVCIESLENTTKPEEQDIYQVSVKIIVHVRIKLSKILYKLHLYNKAQVKAEEGLKIARANSLFSEIFTLQSILGDIYKGQANIKKAIYHYQTALEFKKYLDKNPELIDVYLNLGEIYMNIDKQQAKRYLKKAVDLSKDYHELSIESLNKLGIYYINQKKYEKALRTFQKALDVKETKETLYNICLIYKKQNKNIELLQFAYKYFT